MATEWFYARNGEKRGPVTVAGLRQLAASGQLLPTDLIWKQGMKQWAAARSAKGLFPESSPIPPTPAPSPSEPPFAPIVVTAVRTPPSGRWASASADKGSRRIHALALGALACILAASYDYSEWPRVITVSLSLAHAILNAVLPIAVISRVREGTRKALPYSRRSLFIVLLLAVVVALGMEIGTGFFLATFQWLRFCTLACQVSLGFLLLVPVPRAAERFAIPALAGVLACLNGYSSIRSTAVIIIYFSELIWAPLQLVRNILSNCSAVMIGVAALWFSMRQAFAIASDSSSPGTQQADVRSNMRAATSTAKWFAVAVRGRAADAARLAQLTAERTTLVNVTLPRAYAELGKVVYRDPIGVKVSATKCQAVATLLAERHQIEAEGQTQPPAISLAEKAKKATADAARIARLKALELKLFQQFAGLGEAAYETAGADAGPAECVQTIAKALLRRNDLDAERRAIEDASNGQVVTPKRLMWGAAICVGVGVLLAIGRGRGTDSLTVSGEEGTVPSVASQKSRSGNRNAAGDSSYQEGYRKVAKAMVDIGNAPPPKRSEMIGALVDGLESEMGTKPESYFTGVNAAFQAAGLDLDRVALPWAKRSPKEESAPSSSGKNGSGMYENGYAQGQERARGYKRRLASLSKIADEVVRNNEIKLVERDIMSSRAAYRREREDTHPSQKDLVDLYEGMIDGYESELRK